MDCWMPSRTRCWFTLKKSNCSNAARWSAASFDVMPIDSPNALPESGASAPELSAQSQKQLDAPQQTLSVLQDSVSYSVARGITLASGDAARIRCCSAARDNPSLGY